MNLVPPRRGQRVKSVILPPFMGGNPFQPVAYKAHADGDVVYGIIKRRCKTQSHVWLGYDLKPTLCNNDALTLIALPAVPKHAYTETTATIGGVGRHLRWNIVFPCHRMKIAVSVDVGNIGDIDAFKTFANNILRPFGLCRNEFTEVNGIFSTVVDIPDASKIGIVAAALHCAGYTAIPSDPSFVSGGKLAIERYDRSEHMWWNQTQEAAGPLRDVHRWIYDFLPLEWTDIPFTWQSMCKNITLDPLTESHHLPLPLRDFFLTLHIGKLQEDDAKRHALEQLRGRPSVTCRLSPHQNRQLLTAAYWSTIAPFDATIVTISRHLRFRYMLQGYTSREIGGYKQNAEHLGHGANIRQFRNKPQYRRENLSSRMLNQIYQTDGTLRGSGFKGTRGKYGHKDFPKYQPRKRMRRTIHQEQKMRNLNGNLFTEYRASSAKQKKAQGND